MKKVPKTRALALFLVMIALLLGPIFSNAQNRGFFGYGNYDKSYDNSYGMANRGLMNINDSSETGIVNQTFGEPVPLGNGVVVMLVAGAGYLLLKKKED